MLKNKEKIIMAIQWALFLSMMVTAMFKQSSFLQLRWAGFLIIALSL